MTFFTLLISYLMKDITSDVYDNTGNITLFLYKHVLEANQTSQVVSVSFYSMLLGASLLVLVAAKHIICTYGFGTEGDAEQDPLEIVYRMAMALGIIGSNTWIFNEFFKFTVALGNDVLNIMGKPTDIDINEMLEINSDSPFKLFLTGAIVIGMVVFGIYTCLRAAELTLSRILLPIFAVDLIHSNCEKWKMFIFQYGVSFVSFVLQMICYELFLISYYSMSAANILDYFVVIGWLALAVKTPTWLEKYVYATGTGQAISRGAGRVGQVVMYATMRR